MEAVNLYPGFEEAQANQQPDGTLIYWVSTARSLKNWFEDWGRSSATVVVARWENGKLRRIKSVVSRFKIGKINWRTQIDTIERLIAANNQGAAIPMPPMVSGAKAWRKIAAAVDEWQTNKDTE